MKITLKQIGSQIQAFFNEGVEAMARKTKFVQRRSKLTGSKFLQALVFNSLEKKAMTLSSISQSCLRYGVCISEQGLDERINESSVNFMCELFSQAVKRFQLNEPLAIQLLAQFSGVYLVDSSQISLPASMADGFPGAGGNASPASLKIQLVFDYLCGQLAQLDLRSGREPDQGYRGHWSIIRQGRSCSWIWATLPWIPSSKSVTTKVISFPAFRRKRRCSHPPGNGWPCGHGEPPKRPTSVRRTC